MISFSVHPVARTQITEATQERNKWAARAVRRYSEGVDETDRAYDEYLMLEALGLIPTVHGG